MLESQIISLLDSLDRERDRRDSCAYTDSYLEAWRDDPNTPAEVAALHVYTLDGTEVPTAEPIL